jgi:hypothetical protein
MSPPPPQSMPWSSEQPHAVRLCNQTFVRIFHLPISKCHYSILNLSQVNVPKTNGHIILMLLYPSNVYCTGGWKQWGGLRGYRLPLLRIVTPFYGFYGGDSNSNEGLHLIRQRLWRIASAPCTGYVKYSSTHNFMWQVCKISRSSQQHTYTLVSLYKSYSERPELISPPI